MEQICGFIERITFQNAENGYTVAHIQEPGRSSQTCIVGNLHSIRPGETIRCYGSWKQHLIHGKQFIVDKHQTEIPTDITSIKKYLGSGLIKGIGQTYAGRIVEKFGSETLNIIDQTPNRLTEVQGLGQKRIEKIQSCWSEQKSIREVMIFLQSFEVSPTYALKIFKKYGSQSIQRVKENPYHLARDIFGIGFKTADTIAKKMGIAPESPQRIDSGIEFALNELSSDGHVCYPIHDFLGEASNMLGTNESLVESRLSPLKNEGRIEIFEIVVDGKILPHIWLKPLFLAETGIAREIKRLLSTKSDLRDVNISKALDWVQEKLNIQLAQNQKIAVSCSLSNKIQIVTGGPGTGKSTITNAILTITEKLTDKIILAAPTGRAAKRMSEITKKKASTIHSLLEFDFKTGRFKRNREFPLDCDLIIIDEASMIDTYLMYSLLKAIPEKARVIFVGDICQLPSVGPGNVLKDMIRSNCIEVSQLTEIFRQASGSRIITNAHLINNGTFPDISLKSDSDFYFLEAIESKDVLHNIVNLVSQRLPKKYGWDPINEIQVLAPMKKGEIGTENLNCALQASLNPNGEAIYYAGSKYSIGDKVMQIKNDYKKEVFNGDIGRILSIDNVEQELVVSFEEREVVYDFSDLNELMLSYAVSIHKYQGSECPCIVMPIHTSHFKLLHRNLLYTGVTRGKKLVVLVGTKKALGIAVRNDEVKKRHTGLYQALVGINFNGP